MKHTLLRTSSLIAAAATVGGLANAQINFGNSCPGASCTTPTISATQAVAGSTYTLSITGPASTPGTVIAGFSDSLWLGIPLPVDLTLFGFGAGCELNVSADILGGIVTDANGDYSVNVGSGIAGASVFLQAFMLDADETTIGGLSEGLRVSTLAPANAGDLVITEIFNNPAFVGDGDGECFEVYNPGGTDIDINGWIVRDDDFDSHVIDNGGPLLVPAGGYLALGTNTNTAENGGVDVSYAWGSNGQFFLSNSGDEVVLQVGATEVSRVNYDGGPLFPDLTGASMQLDVTKLNETDNDDGANWSASTCTIVGAGVICNDDLATIGRANDDCTTSPCAPAGGPTGEIIVTEIMQNPSAVGDSNGEYFEVYNTTGSDIDMQGWTIMAGGSPNSEVISGSVVVPAGGYALFARKSDSLVNGGLPTPAYDYVDGLNFSNSSQDVKILDDLGGLVCEINYDNGATFPDPNGASMNLDASKLNITDANVGANWCESTTAYGLGDTGTPGAANESCP